MFTLRLSTKEGLITMNTRSNKFMLLGLALMLVCIYIQGEPGIKLYGNELFIGLFGFILVGIGFFMENKEQ